MIDKRKLIFVFCIIITLLVFYIDKIQYGNRKIVTTHPKYMMNKHVLNCNNYNFYGVNKGISSSISFPRQWCQHMRIYYIGKVRAVIG